MSKLTPNEIRRLAKLARLHLNDSEVASLQKELSAILGYVEQLQAVDTKGVEPTAQVTGLINVMREDALEDYGVSTEQLLSNVPKVQKGFIKVPRILDQS